MWRLRAGENDNRGSGGAGANVAACILGQPDPSILDLARATAVAKLVCKLDDLREAGNRNRMPFAFEPTAWVDREFPANLSRPSAEEGHRLSFRAQMQVLDGNQFGRRCGVMDLDDIDLRWRDRGKFVGAPGCFTNEPGDSRCTRPDGDCTNMHWLRLPARSDCRSCDNHGGCAVRHGRAHQQSQWIRDRSGGQYIVDRVRAPTVGHNRACPRCGPPIVSGPG